MFKKKLQKRKNTKIKERSEYKIFEIEKERAWLILFNKVHKTHKWVLKIGKFLLLKYKKYRKI